MNQPANPSLEQPAAAVVGGAVAQLHCWAADVGTEGGANPAGGLRQEAQQAARHLDDLQWPSENRPNALGVGEWTV